MRTTRQKKVGVDAGDDRAKSNNQSCFLPSIIIFLESTKQPASRASQANQASRASQASQATTNEVKKYLSDEPELTDVENECKCRIPRSPW